MVLLLDTVGNEARVGVADSHALQATTAWPADRMLAETLADRIADFLGEQGTSLDTVERIRIHAGPGGFSSVRVGVTTANVLGYALGIPVEGVVGRIGSLEELRTATPVATTLGAPVVPVYDRPPNITPPKHA